MRGPRSSISYFSLHISHFTFLISVSHPVTGTELQEAIADHLFWWDLRPFTSDRDYERWQRERLQAADLHQLNLLAEARHRNPCEAEPDLAFYEFAAQPRIYPVLYSQRFDYYLTVGAAMLPRLDQSRLVLDFGCGLGILTTLYARQYPTVSFVGLDRSPGSIAVARERTAALGLKNLTFMALDPDRESFTGSYDTVVSSHSLFQSEQDPGLPSRSWDSFARAVDPAAQQAFEARTGLGRRLDWIVSLLAPAGRLLLFEKARHLGRRIGLQRALAGRGLACVDPSLPLHYLSVEEPTDDGPLFVLSRHGDHAAIYPWDESPERTDGDHHFICKGVAAESVWSRLPRRRVTRSLLFKPPGLSSGQLEWGRSDRLRYLSLARASGARGLWVGLPGPDDELDGSLFRSVASADTITSEHLQRLDELLAARGLEDDPSLVPLYENHTAAAQLLWSELPAKTRLKEYDSPLPAGRHLHIELGRTGDLSYLYCANTFDQRQLVLVESDRQSLLEQYFEELTSRTALSAPVSGHPTGPSR
ncbi:Methyltransferase domain-containing protein [Nitrospira tepida]|uniref:Methyltransferase domain-containing protein n=1 Tax=Nitrospira tepida TaxID=2973512 RepID=A0AA86N031_9BACT|nr:Methyltransferase domain-containing protein [Nitrospira tepida]